MGDMLNKLKSLKVGEFLIGFFSVLISNTVFISSYISALFQLMKTIIKFS